MCLSFPSFTRKNFLLAFVLVLLFTPGSFAQGDSCIGNSAVPNSPVNFRNLKHKKVPGLFWVNGWVRGLLEFTPPGYDSTDMVTKYPLIIYFHGVGGSGNGTAPSGSNNGLVGLCRILVDVTTNVSRSLPALIEQQPTVLNHNNPSLNPFIVVSPQFTGYAYPNNFPSSEEVAGVVDSIMKRYRADPRRVYLVGMSSGSNMVMEYVGSSVERAQRIAAVAAPGLCSVHDTTENVERGITPANIGQANLPVWLMQCEGDPNCGTRIPQGWIDGIVDAGGMAPRFHILDTTGGTPHTPSFPCNNFNRHDAWHTMYQPTFSDGPNLYNWLVQFQSSVALPVVLSAYKVTLVNGKAKIEWQTTHEVNNESFTIERAGADQRFTHLAKIPAANIEHGKKYEFVDDRPLSGISYYRLVQTDIDGKKSHFGIKKVINNANAKRIIVSPNPFQGDVSVYITIARSQRISAYVTDLSGRRIQSSNNIYSEGTSELKLKTAQLPKGIYLLKIEAEDFSETQRIIKQ